jgi:hypothetical protein
MSTLWIIGCSITHGIGVKANQRWGQLVSDQLNLPAIFLTAEGSSIEWAANQILQADIKTDDVVLWGLTSPNRFMYYNDSGQAQHILNVYYQSNPHFRSVDKKHLVDLNLAYKAVEYVRQVQNYLNKIGCKYAIGYTLPGLDKHRQILIDALSGTSNFFVAYDPALIKIKVSATEFLLQSRPANKQFIDIGSDSLHPGVLQHQLYADQFLKILNIL